MSQDVAWEQCAAWDLRGLVQRMHPRPCGQHILVGRARAMVAAIAAEAVAHGCRRGYHRRTCSGEPPPLLPLSTAPEPRTAHSVKLPDTARAPRTSAGSSMSPQ